ncbi:phage major capsid protein [Mycolicibacterium phlei]|uniref:phage major capsid protein n=1 Tax=Mycolicibacterium phlei TaxID=1771 RepID=UPI00025AE559|nr:phage major capsid protein [Mycolicibacterium phlei]EID10189.1 phage-related major capsid protein [Mycolicibacterium phlei RIVM601174]
MDARLKRLIELRQAAAQEYDALVEARKAITDKVAAEEREDLTAEEDAEFRAKTAEIRAKQDVIDDLDQQIAALEEERKRAGRQSEAAREIAKATAKVEVVSEARTYEKGNGFSYVQDLMRRHFRVEDDDTMDRLRRHAAEVEKDSEFRNLSRTDGQGGYFVPPLWAMQRFIELARAGRAYANLVPSEPLPAGTDSINIPKIATGTSTAVQSGDNSALTGPGAHETDLTDTSVSAGVKTIAGQQGLSIQLLDQSPLNFDEIVFRDLAADYATKLDIQVISGTGTGNQVVGVRNTAGIETITATSAGGSNLDDVKLVYAKIADAIQRVHTLRFLPPEVIVMHPRRWAWFMSVFDGDDRPLMALSGPGVNQVGVLENVASQQIVGHMHGLPVVTDPNIPTTLGTSTNEDVIHVLRASDLLLFESGIRTRTLEQTRAESLTVLLQVYGYLAFTAARYPKSVVEIAGSALKAPTFA